MERGRFWSAPAERSGDGTFLLRTDFAVSTQMTKPLTPALPPSDGEREFAFVTVGRLPFRDFTGSRTIGLPLLFLKGEGRGEGSRFLLGFAKGTR